MEEFDNTLLPGAKLAAELENGGGKRTLFYKFFAQTQNNLYLRFVYLL